MCYVFVITGDESWVYGYNIETKAKVKETGILIDKPQLEKPKTVRLLENIAAVAASVCEAPSTSKLTFRRHH